MSFVWPDRPTVHDTDPQADGFGPASWRPPRARRGPDDPYEETFRTCSYCGSIHPGDLVELAAKHELRFESADWKYGWPHKFYIQGIPNPVAGTEVLYYTYGPRDRIAGDAAAGFEPEPYDLGGVQRWRVVSSTGTAPATAYAKWYSVHLADLDGQAFSALGDLVAAKANIRFERDGDRLRYRVSYRGN